MSASLSFRVGDKVVYPNHGVGVIEHIASRAVGDTCQDYYLLKIESSNLRVMIPFTNVASVGMRALTQARELALILTYLQEPPAALGPADWKWRFKENSDKMRAGSLAQIAEVLKNLVQLHQTKPLSFREKKMLDRAVMLLTGEMASAKNMPVEDALALLQETLAHATLVLPPLDPDTEHA
ncbi:MAG TPA: CarD family transcriptional regulator [Terriglobales bacterium]|nr:CarD family transcriptional regulator [Terriglobales bacterium]